MAGSLLLPVQVSAKVVKAQEPVPPLDGTPFAKSLTLEKGIHVHWALPDMLTRSRLAPGKGKDVAIFPGVPDLWLVVRFNPAPPMIPGLEQKRHWKAWVVDSVKETATDLSAWQPPTDRDSTKIHTLAGMLPKADGIGFPGGGIFDPKVPGNKFNPAMAAYYPECRQRFGFLDTVSDLAGSTGKITYVVVGWFADRGWDPLWVAANKSGYLEQAKVLHQLRPNGYDEICASASAGGIPPVAWTPASINVLQTPAPTTARLNDVKKAASRGGTLASRAKQLGGMLEQFPAPPTAPGGPVQGSADYVASIAGPMDTVCHGSLYDVPLTGSGTVPVNPTADDIRIYPSIKRAVADLASKHADTENIDFVEMMLQDVDNQKGTIAGVFDLPGAAHALTFQSVQGRSRFYGRLDIYGFPKAQQRPYIDLGKLDFAEASEGAGYWPLMDVKSKSANTKPDASRIPTALRREPSVVNLNMTDAQKAAFYGPWRTEIRNAFTAAANIAKDPPVNKPFEPRLVYVRDYRAKAQSLELGHSPDGSGSDGAGWWLDLDSDEQLDELRILVGGAILHLFDADNSFEVPGSRWNRPWAPQLALFGMKRTTKYSERNRWSVDGYVKGRVSGDTSIAVSVGSWAPVFGKDMIAEGSALFSAPGLPTDTRSLLQESMLFDAENAGIMASLTSTASTGGVPRETARAHFTSAVRGIWMQRIPKIRDANQDKFDAISLTGEIPDDGSLSVWKDPTDPLFVDVNYTHAYSSLATDWELQQDEVEMTPKTPGVTTNPPANQVQWFEERSMVSATIVNMLQSALGGKETVDFNGETVKTSAPPAGVTEDTFKELDIISAPLTALDSGVFGGGRRERTGALRVNKLELFDMYGLGRSWNSGEDKTSPLGNPAWPYWTELAPRLPYWSRLGFRLQSANTPSEEATPIAGPVCGFLVPDFVDHALEVFDYNGTAIGQLTTDPPQPAIELQQNPAPLEVQFALHPWVAAEINLPPGSDPVNAIENLTLRSLVATLRLQSFTLPQGTPPDKFCETGLSAMLRVIDTVRGTVDLSKKTHDRRVRLLGEPILVLAARLSIDATATQDVTVLAKSDPPTMTAPPELPQITVRVGDITRPDDGVLGCFVTSGPDGPKFRPVSTLARDNAIVNVLALGGSWAAGTGKPADHPFIENLASQFVLRPGESVDITLLADPRAGLYATCGPLPRKKITVPREFIDNALKHLEPTFRVGPIMTAERNQLLKALVPPPEIEGHKTEFVYAEEDSFPETPVSPVPPAGELPAGRAKLADGWLRVFQV